MKLINQKDWQSDQLDWQINFPLIQQNLQQIRVYLWLRDFDVHTNIHVESLGST